MSIPIGRPTEGLTVAVGDRCFGGISTEIKDLACLIRSPNVSDVEGISAGALVSAVLSDAETRSMVGHTCGDITWIIN